jgi:hypothetical protein
MRPVQISALSRERGHRIAKKVNDEVVERAGNEETRRVV